MHQQRELVVAGHHAGDFPPHSGGARVQFRQFIAHAYRLAQQLGIVALDHLHGERTIEVGARAAEHDRSDQAKGERQAGSERKPAHQGCRRSST
ncbi:hypothetical protein UB46_37345 [Burkholderiaceae bacterium 16]|nr:hypothetical protein UB46_37345 [Burkholderiaceae bacterium 16]